MKEKRCRQCKTKFTPRDAFDAKVRKFCTPKCYTDAKRVKRKQVACRNCNKVFEERPALTTRRFCSGTCFYQHAKKSRTGKGNPNFRGGIWARKTGLFRHGSKTAGKHLRACSKYKKKFIERNGYACCEVCRTSGAYRYSTHHLYYASRFPKHPNLHDDRNLILLCEECHRRFHASEMMDHLERLEKERGLKELFAEHPAPALA